MARGRGRGRARCNGDNGHGCLAQYGSKAGSEGGRRGGVCEAEVDGREEGRCKRVNVVSKLITFSYMSVPFTTCI